PATPRRADADRDARAAAVPAAGARLVPLVLFALGLVVKEGGKLNRRHAYHLRRSRFRQRREERLDGRLDRFEPRQHAVVLQSAEARRVRLGPVPGSVPSRPCDAPQNVRQLSYFLISFHRSPLCRSNSTCSRSNCLPRCTRHLTVDTGTLKNAAMRLSGISSRKRRRSAIA